MEKVVINTGIKSTLVEMDLKMLLIWYFELIVKFLVDQTILVSPFQQQIKDVKGRRFEGKSLRAQKERRKKDIEAVGNFSRSLPGL